jgi:hypothetical protein
MQRMDQVALVGRHQKVGCRHVVHRLRLFLLSRTG